MFIVCLSLVHTSMPYAHIPFINISIDKVVNGILGVYEQSFPKH